MASKIFLLYKKPNCSLETNYEILCLSMSVITLVTILYTKLQREIGLVKSTKVTRLSFFGIRVIKVDFKDPYTMHSFVEKSATLMQEHRDKDLCLLNKKSILPCNLF